MLKHQSAHIHIELIQRKIVLFNQSICSIQEFDDETKQIRNDTNKLLRKIHSRVGRAQSCLPIGTYTAK